MFLIQFALCNACKSRRNLVLTQQSLSLIYKVLFQALFQLNYMISFNTVLQCVAYEYSCLFSLLLPLRTFCKKDVCASAPKFHTDDINSVLNLIRTSDWSKKNYCYIVSAIV